MVWLLVLSHIACLIGGMAFFKHRQKIKDNALAEAANLKKSAETKAKTEINKL